MFSKMFSKHIQQTWVNWGVMHWFDWWNQIIFFCFSANSSIFSRWLRNNVFCVPFFVNVFGDSLLKLQLNFQCCQCAVQVTLPNVSCFTRSKQNYRCTTLAIADTLVRLQTPITLQKCSIPIRYSVTSFHFFLWTHHSSSKRI